MTKLYNGKNATLENVKEMMMDLDISLSDMTEDEENIIKKVAIGDYDNAEDDMAYLMEQLSATNEYGYDYPEINCQNIFDILSTGDWFYNA